MFQTKSDTYVRRLQGYDKSWSGPTQVPAVSSPWSVSYSGGRTRTTETQTPGWRRRIAKGENATTYLSGSVDSINYVPGVFYRYLYDKSVDVAPSFGQSRWEITGPLSLNPGSLPASLPNSLKIQANNEALSHFITRVNELQSAFKGGVFLGELKESLDLVLHLRKTCESGSINM